MTTDESVPSADGAIDSPSSLPLEVAPPAMSPPTQPGRLGTPTPTSAWPAVLGTICIVVGALGILGGLWGVLWPIVFPMIASSLPREMVEEFGAQREVLAWTVAGSVVTLGLAVLLLIVGVGLHRRRRSSVVKALWWAGFKIVLVFANTFMVCFLQLDQVHLLGGTGGGVGAGAANIGLAIGIVVSIGWGCALPVFMLTWLSRRVIREECRDWL